ncbi:MAG: ribonuclease R [Neisseriaceae bacterium]
MSNSVRSSVRTSDPYLEREKEKYTHPLPSREWILRILEVKAIPITQEALEEILEITDAERVIFHHRIKAMVRDGQVYINRRRMICVAEKLDLVKCRVEAHKDGFGFAVPLEEKAGRDYLLSEKTMRALMHGDIVMIHPGSFDRRGRREGRVVEILQRKHQEVVARLHVTDGVTIAIPEDKRLNQTILLPGTEVEKFLTGQVAVIVIDHYPDRVTPATGHIKEILGCYTDSGMEIEIAVRKHHLAHKFSQTALDEAAALVPTISAVEVQHRRDLRELPLLTIDGETAKDFDDAVCAVSKPDGSYQLIVAIADVSHYVQAGSTLDQEAYERGNSVYFPRRVLPMLPEALSNGLCSLVPQADRLCMVCDMTIDASGIVRHYEFYPGIMHSRARLTYTEVWNILQARVSHPCQKELMTLYTLYQHLRQQRKERGAIEFEGLQTQMIFDENNKIKKIIPEARNDAYRLIEECMLAANVSAAKFLLRHKHQALFRVHEGPTMEKLQILKQQLSLLGLSLKNYEDPKPTDYARLLGQLEERADKSLVETMLLRSLQQAVYQPENVGHFGLAYEAYTHFTSPIRRYPDLCVHRAIKGILKQQFYHPKSWSEIGLHCSGTERRAEEASREVEKWLKTYYMKDKLGEIFEGTISGLSSFGVFVMLKEIYIEGMIHISDLGQDYFHYVPEQLSAIGERTKVRFTVGDGVIVKVAQIDLDTCKIDLVLVSGGKKDKNSKDRAEPDRPSRLKKKSKSKSIKPNKGIKRATA